MRASDLTTKNLSKRRFSRVISKIFRFPTWRHAALAALSAILLILSFPDFDLWFLAWFALVPLLVAIEKNKDSAAKSFWLGLLQGTAFFYGTCWWLTNAPIVYGGIPAPIVYFLLLPATLGAGFFTGVFAAVLSRLLKRFGNWAIFTAPFVWTACEFLRYWLTGNAWNALGYSQAFVPSLIQPAKIGGVFLISFLLTICNAIFAFLITKSWRFRYKEFPAFGTVISIFVITFAISYTHIVCSCVPDVARPSAVIVALQPNVPMSGLKVEDYFRLRRKHVEMAETALREVDAKPELKDLSRIVVFPESPMNFGWAQDSEFREFAQEFTTRNRTALLFNAGEPTLDERGFHNSAVFLNNLGEKVAQYDKIRLVPFGEFVPEWIPGNEFLPTVVGRMKPGKDFRVMPFGADVRAGVMICYESAFGDISSAFVQNGADVLIEITNDGYSGNTPIMRQHLANAVFRAVETNRPVVRATNTGITAFIDERGEVKDTSGRFETATRVWTIARSDGKKTFYVRYGDLFAVVCTILTLVFLGFTFLIKRKTV